MEGRWDDLNNFLSLGIYPAGYNKSQRLNLRRYASKFTLKEGDLFYGQRKVIKSKEDAKELFKEFHCLPMGAHTGILKTRNAMCSRFYWHGMSVDIDNWVLECDKCQKVGKPQSSAQPEESMKIPFFVFLDMVELFMQKGKYPAGASRALKRAVRIAAKNFRYKDGRLWRTYRGRLLRVVRSEEEVREILTRYHNNNNHPGRVRTVKEIMLMYYWMGVTEAVRSWIEACAVCQTRTEAVNPVIRCCLAYGCDASSDVCPELSFHRFPKQAERRRCWLALAQRDEASLRNNSLLCSRHFNPSCFTQSDAGQQVLAPDAVPTVSMAVQEDKVHAPSDDDFAPSDTLADLSAAAAAAAEPADGPEAPAEVQEHQYYLSAAGLDCTERDSTRREVPIEPRFVLYNQIARYLRRRVLPMQSKTRKRCFKRMTERFILIDGVLMYTRVSPPVKVPRSRQEVNSILTQFHDNQGHCGQGRCQKQISQHFFWDGMARDLSRWITGCSTCLNRTQRKLFRCSVLKCTNCCGPVERGLGLTFHSFPQHSVALLGRWLRAVGRPHWFPRLWSSICSTHFTDDCFERSGEQVTLRPDAVPTLFLHGDAASLSPGDAKPAAEQKRQHAYFAKYDAVELYLSARTYPPQLTYPEKNTFRRFCKKFTMKDGSLHLVRGDRLLLVLRSRQQVEAALVDYHNELNHLEIKKCLRLLNERYFWKTMRADVVQWISSCSHCSSRTTGQLGAAAGASDSLLEWLSRRGDEDSDEGDGGRLSGEEKHRETTSEVTPSAPQPWAQTSGDVQVPEAETPAEDQEQNGSDHFITLQSVAAPPASDSQPPPRPPQTSTSQQIQPLIISQSQTPPQAWSCSSRKKRKSNQEQMPGPKRSCSKGLDPVEVASSKPWPVFSIAGSKPTAEATPPAPEAERPAVSPRPRELQARTVLQQCTEARVKVRAAVEGAEAQWAEIQEGMVVYVCFFHGATEDVTQEMARSLMTTRLFRRDSGHSVSVLDLPGSVLLVPQFSLLGEAVPGRGVEYRGGCELWRGALLFSSLVSACRELLSASARASRAGRRVEHGVYGHKQELVLSSVEPLTLLLEF